MSQIDYVELLDYNKYPTYTSLFDDGSIYFNQPKAVGGLSRTINKSDLSYFYDMTESRLNNLTDAIFDLLTSKGKNLTAIDWEGIKKMCVLKMFVEMPISEIESVVYEYVINYRQFLNDRNKKHESVGRAVKYDLITPVQKAILLLDANLADQELGQKIRPILSELKALQSSNEKNLLS